MPSAQWASSRGGGAGRGNRPAKEHVNRKWQSAPTGVQSGRLPRRGDLQVGPGPRKCHVAGAWVCMAGGQVVVGGEAGAWAGLGLHAQIQPLRRRSTLTAAYKPQPWPLPLYPPSGPRTPLLLALQLFVGEPWLCPRVLPPLLPSCLPPCPPLKSSPHTTLPIPPILPPTHGEPPL